MTWMQWIQIVEIPVISFVIWQVYRNRDALSDRIEKTREELAHFQIKVANDYASVRYLKDVEARIMRGLERLEKKIDRVVEGNRGAD